MKSQGLGRGLAALIDGQEKRVPLKQDLKKEVTSKIVVKEKTTDIVKKSKNGNKNRNKNKNTSSNTEYQYLDITKIETNPFQPRKNFDEVAIDELANSISKSGFITPVIVTKKANSDKYILVAGERRLRACKKLGLAEIPAIVKDLNESQIIQIAIVENVQRKNLNPIEEAKAYQNMLEKLKLTSEEASKSLGLPNYYLSQKLKLVLLPEFVQNYVSSGELSEGAAVALLKLESNEAIIAAAKIAVRQKMTRVSVEKLVEKIMVGKGIQPKTQDFYFRSKYQYMMDSFKDNLGWSMKIKTSQGGKGKIEIEFTDEMNLKDIYDHLEKIL